MPSYSSLKIGLLASGRSRISTNRCETRSLILFFLLGSTFLFYTTVLSSRWLPHAAQGSSAAPELNVCLITADFWGADAAGGTATAFELLARELQKAGFPTTLVGVSPACEPRAKFNAAHKDLKSAVFLCEEHLDAPLEKETFPFEKAGLLALKWLRSAQERQCDIVHWHEWGGMAVPGLVASDSGFLPPNQRHIVQLHGGHNWSGQHLERQLHDLIALRIDANEKLSIELAHELTSPTQYIADWYGARGWKLPKKLSVVPNCMSLPPLFGKNTTSTTSPTTESHATTSSYELMKPVKTVAFFGRLESRKGIELFFDAISMLPTEILSKPDFQVLIIGGAAQIQSQNSEEWIKIRIKSLPKALNASQVVLKVGLSREKALKEVLNAETVIAFGSFIENAPNALVEASILGLPYISLDTGGVQEVVDLEGSSADVLFNPLNLTETTIALAAALEVRLQAGKAAVPKLRPAYAQGNKLWVDWHMKVAQEMKYIPRKKYYQKEVAVGSGYYTRRHLIESRPALLNNIKSETFYLNDGPNSLIRLHKEVCASDGDPSNIVLLVPGKGISINQALWSQTLLPMLHENLDRKLHAVVLGAQVASFTNNDNTLTNTTVAFAGSPTWTYYSNDRLCTPAAPLAIRRKTLCGLRLLSRNFQRADVWTLALLMKKSGLEVAPLPFSEAAVLTQWQIKKCQPENPPAWSFDHDITANLRYDPQIALFKDLAILGKSPEPLTTFLSDHRHWKVFPESARTQDCDGTQLVPPYFCDNILHPSSNSTAAASFTTWFALDSVEIRGEVRACPFCAEGPVSVEVLVIRNIVVNTDDNSEKENNLQVIWTHEFHAGTNCDAKILVLNGVKINSGDEIRLIARSSSAGHSCAGIFVHRFDIYPSVTRKN